MKNFIPIHVVALLFALCSIQSMAEIDSVKVDSLKSIVEKSTGRDKYSSLLELIYEFAEHDNKRALKYALQAREIAFDIAEPELEAESTRLVGQVLRRIGDNSRATTFLLKAMKIAKQHKLEKEEMRLANSLAIAFMVAGRYDSSLHFHLQSLRMRTEREQHGEMAISLAGIGLLYYKMGENDEALKFNEAALNELQGLHEPIVHQNLLINTALCYINAAGYEKAAQLLNKWDSLYHDKASLALVMSRELAQGLFYINQSMFDLALKHSRAAHSIATKIQDGRFEVESTIVIARCLYPLGQRSQAKELLAWCEDRAIETDSKLELNLTYQALLGMLQMENDLASLARVQGKLLVLREKIGDERIHNRIAVTRVEFAERQNKERIAEQAQIIDLNERVISQQTVLIVISVSLALVLGVLVYFLVRFNKYQKQISTQLERKVSERTRELKASEDSLIKALGEQRAVMTVVSGKVRSSIATFRGLWQICAAQSPQWKSFVAEFEHAADDLLQVSSIVDKSSALRSASNVEIPVDNNTLSAPSVY